MANAVVRRSLISVGLAGVLGTLAVQAVGDSIVVPGSKAAGMKNCVRPTEFMRRNHMELILHQRHETVHFGIRDTKYSLEGCIDCHVSYGEDGKPIPVDAEDQFCESCHEYTGIMPDCFGCHSPVPNPAPATKPLTGTGTKSDAHPTAEVGDQAAPGSQTVVAEGTTDEH